MHAHSARKRLLLLLILLGPAAAPLAAQGKIDGVEREAREGRRRDHDDDDGGSFFFLEIVGDVFEGVFGDRRTPGQGYGRWPYADRGDEPFVRRNVKTGRRYWTLAATYFDDDVSTLQGGLFAVEGGNGLARYTLEVATYRERTPVDTDHLTTIRAAIGGVPTLGRNVLLPMEFGVRSVLLDTGSGAVGPEIGVGFQAFPARPWSVAGTLRLGFVSWSPHNSSAVFDVAATVGAFLGAVELQAGYRRLQIGEATAFNGPTLGARLWF
jgi:hypothetical protein